MDDWVCVVWVWIDVVMDVVGVFVSEMLVVIFVEF